MAQKTIRRIDIFVSSPADVTAERSAVSRVVEKLNKMKHVSEKYVLRAMRHEDYAPAKIGLGPQDVVDQYMMYAAQADIFICVLWSRMGTPVVDEATGRRYQSGTEYEFSSAYEAYRKNGIPHILLYQMLKPYPPEVEPQQLDLVKRFFQKFHGESAPLKGYYRTCNNTDEFEDALYNDIDTILAKHFISVHSDPDINMPSTSRQDTTRDTKSTQSPTQIDVLGNLRDIRQAIQQSAEYIENAQTEEGVWLRPDLFPTGRTLFFLLVAGVDVSEKVIERAVHWLQSNLLKPGERPDGVAMALLALCQARKLGYDGFDLEAGLQKLLESQNPAIGDWPGRYALPRYSATATAYCIQALRACAVELGTSPELAKACYRGSHYLQRYFHTLDWKGCSYVEIVNPIEALLLPYYEAWGIIDSIQEIRPATRRVQSMYDSFMEQGNTKAVAGVLTLSLTNWRGFDAGFSHTLSSWLIRERNADHGWTEHTYEPSEPHHTAMISLPMRQLERLGDHYIPLSLLDDFTKAIIGNVDQSHSVGAVVYREMFGVYEVLMLRRHDRTWVLPKGHIEDGENEIQALTRELAEETGISHEFLSVERLLGEYRYLFRPRANVVVDKKVTYYLVKCLGNGMKVTSDEDHAEARWLPFYDAVYLPIYYDDAREAIRIAQRLIMETNSE